MFVLSFSWRRFKTFCHSSPCWLQYGGNFVQVIQGRWNDGVWCHQVCTCNVLGEAAQFCQTRADFFESENGRLVSHGATKFFFALTTKKCVLIFGGTFFGWNQGFLLSITKWTKNGAYASLYIVLENNFLNLGRVRVPALFSHPSPTKIQKHAFSKMLFYSRNYPTMIFEGTAVVCVQYFSLRSHNFSCLNWKTFLRLARENFWGLASFLQKGRL